MDDARIGRALRELRRRRGWRQQDLADAVGVAQSLISSIERGHAAGIRLGVLRRAFLALDAGLEGLVLWRGGGLDRLLDWRHATIGAAAMARLDDAGWASLAEVTYSVYGERGSIDVLGAHHATRSVVIEEVKSELTSIEALLRKTDEKVRIVRGVLCRERFGWGPRNVGRVLVLPDTSAARAAVRRHERVLRTMFPAAGVELNRWLRAPSGDIGAIQFLPNIAGGVGTRRPPAPQRVRVPSERPPRA